MSVTEAAKKLGVTDRAVRYRLKKGVMRGRKVDGIWYVYKNNKGLR